MKKIAIIGATGFASERMIPELQKSKVCEVVVILARNKEKVESVARQFSIQRTYTDIHKMLEDDVYDVVYIATPPYMHFEEIKTCIDSGKVRNILCEKPIVLTEGDLIKIQELSAKNPQVSLYVGHHIRHQKAIKDIKYLVETGAIGDVTSSEGEWSYNLDPHAQYAVWKLDKSKGGPSVMGDPGIHVIDIMYLLFGKPEQIITKGSSVVHKTTYDNVTATFIYKGKEILVTASQTKTDAKNELLIVGTKGEVRVKNCFSQTYIPEVELCIEGDTKILKYDETLLYKNEMESILGFYNDGVPATSFNDAVAETEVLLEINKQIK